MITTNARECQESGRAITALILQLAKEAANDGRVDLCELSRILSVIDGMQPIYEMARARCHKNTLCGSIAYRRNQLLGRILAQPLEGLLFAYPPLLDRRVLTPLFGTIAKAIGETVYTDLEARARALYFRQLSTPTDFEWGPFYADQQSLDLYCRAITLFVDNFRVYAPAKAQFINQMKAMVDSFSFDDFYVLVGGMTRPLQMGAEASPHRAYLENFRPSAERRAIDSFLTVFSQDRQRWRELAAVRRRFG